MPKSKTIIVYPYLNDHKGDLSCAWFVEWRYQLPNEKNMRRERVYQCLNKGTAEERHAIAHRIILQKREWLQSGDYLRDNNFLPVRENQLEYKHTAKIYGDIKSGLPTMQKNFNDYLTEIKPVKGKNAYAEQQAKLRMFAAWISENHFEYLDVKHFDRKMITNFVVWLAEKYNYSKITVKKYLQVLRWYFDFEIERKRINCNPVQRIPNTGRICDEAATPFTERERKLLKETIKPQNPQLWLQCEMMFYCAIRPGVELRFMKISDIDLERRQIRVPATLAKNDRTEFVDIPDILMLSLQDCHLEKFPQDYYLFGKEGTPSARCWSKNHFRYAFNKFRDALCIPNDRKFYSWKHTGAITLIQNGAKPYDLMEHLRHKNFETTEKYLKKRMKNPEKRINQFVSEI